MERFMAQAAEQQNDEGQSHANKPVDEVRYGNVKIPIWRNSTANGDFYTAGSPQVSYKDDQGNWKESKSHIATDMLMMSKATG
jgi:hypothetical protein